jgi:hypothetical protein
MTLTRQELGELVVAFIEGIMQESEEAEGPIDSSFSNEIIERITGICKRKGMNFELMCQAYTELLPEASKVVFLQALINFKREQAEIDQSAIPSPT